MEHIPTAALAGMTLFGEKIYKIEKASWLSKVFQIKYLRSLLVISASKLVFTLGKAHTDPFFEKLDPKITVFRGFTNFFQNYWIAKFDWKSPKNKVVVVLGTTSGLN